MSPSVAKRFHNLGTKPWKMERVAFRLAVAGVLLAGAAVLVGVIVAVSWGGAG